MKTNILIGLIVSVFILHRSSSRAQGTLTPPGAPAPMMKTLDQIEARTPISSLPCFIGQSGSYYLTGNFSIGTGQSYGIFISAVNVTVDLNGFTIRSSDANNTSVGILIDSSQFADFHDISIVNGHIVGNVLLSGGIYSGSGFGYGIYSSGTPYNVRVSGVTASGCLHDGINVGWNSTVVESCAVTTVGGKGIFADSISRSAARQCGMYGIYAHTASECYGDTGVLGINGINADAANNCYGAGGSDGLTANVANNCFGYGNGDGIGLSANSANNCFGYGSGNGAGLSAIMANNCYGYSAGSGNGVQATSAQNCYGSSTTSGYGVTTSIAIGSYGYSASGTGLSASTALSCYGYSNGSGAGVNASTAENCNGQSYSGYGVNAPIASNCYGYSSTGIGVHCIYPFGYQPGVATGCFGYSGSSVGINAYIANGSVGYAPTPISVSFKYNMP